MAKTELVFVPTPAMGHLLSMVEFAKLIVETNPDISALVIIYHMSIIEPTKIASYIDTQSRLLDPTRIAFVILPPLSTSPDPLAPDFFDIVTRLQFPLLRKAIEDRGAKPAAFVLDLMNVSMIDVANELRIPSYVYFPAGATFLYSMFHFQSLADEMGTSDFAELDSDPDTDLDMLGFRNRVPAKVFPWVMIEKDTVSNWPWLVINLARKFREAKGILVNTFMELESTTIQALREQDKIPSVYPVGPILSLNDRGGSKSSDNKSDDEDAVVSWLDEQPESSVVFLCFGSMGSIDVEQVKEIANGLERSGQRFLWSLRKPLEVGTLGAVPSEDEIFEDALPEGFLDRTAHRGKVIPWAPQVTVLAHKAVGGFVSHCGWNSILESIWFGVPIATWPMYSEQQLNAFTLVKELGLAVEITLDYRWDFKKRKGSFLVTADEVEIGVKKLMSIDEETKGKVREMSDTSRKVLQDQAGSSQHWLTRFIGELRENAQVQNLY